MKQHSNPLLVQPSLESQPSTKRVTHSGAFVDIKHDSHAVVLTANQTAKYIGYSPKTLANWRVRGVGPGWLQYCEGGKILYPRSQLDQWLASHGRRSTTRR